MSWGNDARTGEAMRVTVIGLLLNLALVAIKYAAGFAGRSGAMVADATHSLSDAFTDVALLFGFLFVGKPPDKGHKYGHGKIETLAAAFCGGVLFLAGIGILIPAMTKIYGVLFRNEVQAPPEGIALFAAILSIVVKESLYRYTAAVGKRIKSPAIIANAWDHRSDALSSIGTGLGIAGAIFGGPRLAILDPIAAAVVSLLIFKAAWPIVAESLNELLEASIGEEGERIILDIIASQEGVRGFHAVKSRKIGYYIAVEAHILVDRHLSIVQAHDIATQLEHKVRHEFGKGTQINIHVEPMDESRNVTRVIT